MRMQSPDIIWETAVCVDTQWWVAPVGGPKSNYCNYLVSRSTCRHRKNTTMGLMRPNLA